MNKTELIQKAVENRPNAYVPYSNYPVSAALITTSGKLYTGVNIENAAYPVTVCAERVAIFKAVSEGERIFEMIAVVTEVGKKQRREAAPAGGSSGTARAAACSAAAAARTNARS